MKTKLTESQIQWASQHDWFVRRSGNQIIVIGYDGEMVWVGSFKQLRDWAGY